MNVSKNNSPASSDLRRLYNRFAKDYDLVEGTFDALSGVAWLRDRWLRKARGRVLEVGAGTARTVRNYEGADQVVLSELSDRMLQRGLQRATNSPLNNRIRPMQCDMQHLPFLADSFDTVVSSQTLCTVPDPVAALREMGRVCRPDGRILLSEHGLSDQHQWVNTLLEHYTDLSVEHLGCHPNRDHVALAREAGLHIVQVQRSHLGVFIRLELAP